MSGKISINFRIAVKINDIADSKWPEVKGNKESSNHRSKSIFEKELQNIILIEVA